MERNQSDKKIKSLADIELQLSVLKYKIKGLAFLIGNIHFHCVPTQNEMGGISDMISGFADEITPICTELVEIRQLDKRT